MMRLFYRFMLYWACFDYEFAIYRRDIIDADMWAGRIDDYDLMRRRRKAITDEINVLLKEIDGWATLANSRPLSI